MHLSGLTSLHRLSFVRKEAVHDDIYTFYFQPAKPLNHTAGQHCIFLLPGLVRPHPFSLLNAPEEEFLMIGTHVRAGSAFKQRLAAMKSGDLLYCTGPILNFTLEPAARQLVFLANGIGITPFRSMLVHASQAKLPVDITLVHADGPQPAYQSETQALVRQASYPTDKAAFESQLRDIVRHQQKAHYYISGSPGFVSGTKKQLRAAGIVNSAIKTDGFWGY